MFRRWLIGLYVRWFVGTVFREDPLFEVDLDQDPTSELVKLTLSVFGSNRKWRVRAHFDMLEELNIVVHYQGREIPYREHIELDELVSVGNPVVLEFVATPIRSGSGGVGLFFEAAVGIGGSIHHRGVSFGLGNQEKLIGNEQFQTEQRARWELRQSSATEPIGNGRE